MPTCECQKPQFTGIPCNHVLAVCCQRNLDLRCYVSPYYSVENYVNTWSGQFYGFGNAENWPYDMGAPIIRPDPTKINKGRRKHKRIPNSMDDMEARIRPRAGVQRPEGSRGTRTSGGTGGRRGTQGSRRSISGSRAEASAMYTEATGTQGSRRSISGSRAESSAMYAEATGTQRSRRSISGSRAEASAMYGEATDSQAEVSGSQASGSRPFGSRSAGRLFNRIFKRSER